MAFSCPKCRDEFYDRLKFCPNCGFDFTQVLKKCPKCRLHVPSDSKICPECGLDFEKWAFMVPRIVLLSILAFVVIVLFLFPWVWKTTPLLHDKGIVTEGLLMSDIEGEKRVPLFINWRTGERYLELSAKGKLKGYNTDYMNKLVPLPPEVVFHYDIRTGEKVWIIRRVKGSKSNEWVQIGRWVPKGNPSKYGWVHATNISTPP